MKIRSLTCFAGSSEALPAGARFLEASRRAYVEAGFEVQTVRLALPPLSVLFEAEASASDLVAFGRELQERGHDLGIDYLSLGPHLPSDPASWAECLPEVLSETQRVFATLSLTGRKSGVSSHQAALAARVVCESAGLEPNGFANLRFSTLANVPAGVPFLPAAYAPGGGLAFAVATESADLVREAFAQESDLREASRKLSAAIEERGAALEATARTLEKEHTVTFTGIDFSPAPFPRDADSVGAAIESMGVSAAGRPGSIAAAAVITSAIDRAKFTRTGFSGLFLPVLEDDRLALRAAEGHLRLEDLLLASTVCGTGLDTIPLPGDTTPEQILPWLLDLGAIAIRLDKPLTARLMPMPGKKAGDALRFDFPYFASGRVMEMRGGTVNDGLRTGNIPVLPRRPR